MAKVSQELSQFRIDTSVACAAVLKHFAQKYPCEASVEELALRSISSKESRAEMSDEDFAQAILLAERYGNITRDEIAKRCETDIEEILGWTAGTEFRKKLPPRFARPIIVNWLSEMISKNIGERLSKQ